jgi:hypothetical protein
MAPGWALLAPQYIVVTGSVPISEDRGFLKETCARVDFFLLLFRWKPKNILGFHSSVHPKVLVKLLSSSCLALVLSASPTSPTKLVSVVEEQSPPPD